MGTISTCVRSIDQATDDLLEWARKSPHVTERDWGLIVTKIDHIWDDVQMLAYEAGCYLREAREAKKAAGVAAPAAGAEKNSHVSSRVGSPQVDCTSSRHPGDGADANQ